MCSYTGRGLAGVREADTRRIMGGTLIDDVWVPSGTMERTSPPPPLTIHPCRNPLLPPGVYIWNGTPSYIYIYILLSFFHTLAQHCVRCVETRRAGTSCPTNWDLSLLPSRDGSYAISLHAHSRVTKKCASHLYVYIYMRVLSRDQFAIYLFLPSFFFFFFSLSPFFLSYFSARQIKGTHVATVLRVSARFLLRFPSWS